MFDEAKKLMCTLVRLSSPADMPEIALPSVQLSRTTTFRLACWGRTRSKILTGFLGSTGARARRRTSLSVLTTQVSHSSAAFPAPCLLAHEIAMTYRERTFEQAKAKSGLRRWTIRK